MALLRMKVSLSTPTPQLAAEITRFSDEPVKEALVEELASTIWWFLLVSKSTL